MLRGDLERCLIVAPGSLVEQWQEELADKFGLKFELLTRQLADSVIDASVFTRFPLLIARMDQLSRSDDLKAPPPHDRIRGWPRGPRRSREPKPLPARS